MAKQLELKVNGMNAIMENKYITIQFNEEGKAKSLKFEDQELLNNLSGEDGDPDKNNCFYCDYHVKGGTVNMKPDQLKVIENNQDRIHIAYIDSKSKLGIEYHLMMKPNSATIYSYVKAWNNSSEKFAINEFRTVYRLDHNLFNVGYNGERMGNQPTSAHMLTGEKLQDETFKMCDGSYYDNSQVYSKYDYAGYFKNTDFWGQFGDKFGFWFIPVDKSYYGCGPLAQDLMVHYDSIILNYMTSEHFGRDMFVVPVNWEKVYGPWCIYLNHGDLKDAQKQATKEKKEWPYLWVKDKDYSTSVVNVIGNLNSQYKATKYMMVLASDPNDGAIIQQKNGFTYYAETNQDNRFEIKNVRSGKYTLYAYAIDSDDLGTHNLGEVEVKDLNSKQDLGSYLISKHEQTLWQIGTSAHTTEGFKFSNQLRNFIWKDLVPTNLIYRVGHGDDWYYLQNDSGKWQIIFDTDSNYDGELELQIAFAGVTQKDMKDVNGTRVTLALNGSELRTEHFGNDRAAYRSAMKSGAYHLWKISIPAQLLKKHTENVLTIKTNGYLMYDSIRMLKKER